MEPDQTRIDSREHAELVATDWAHREGRDGERARIYARDWLVSTDAANRTALHLRWMLASFNKFRAEQEAELDAPIRLLADLSFAWELELVKHLVLLNAAGLAGVTALIAGRNGSDYTLQAAAALFLLGCGLAVLNLHFNSQGLHRRHQAMKSRRKMFSAANTWHDVNDVAGAKENTRADRLHNLAILLGWISAIFAFVAISLVIYGVMKTQT
ncbi:hypothetical protein [Bordetella genomosp. 1]|uniref:hypothetical protein n=1 Tax=Bordetella genomosp. 1 TaxID=1395607 RepID=UPI0011780B10|nr:hypothetical protein [Bordetella genomosp. 1]